MGIYINQPRVDNLKIIYNKRDAAKVKDPSKILRVNKDNIKFGKSKNLDARHKEYKKIFGENTNFKIVIQIDNYEKLVNFENHLKKVFEPFCLRSPSNGVQMEWMEKISFMDAENTIKEEYKRKDATFKWPWILKKNYYLNFMFSFIWQFLSGIIIFIILGFGLFYIAKLFFGF